MSPHLPAVMAIVGRSKVGKTTVLEKLIPVLTHRGLKVGTIKHHPHDFEIDVPGKDTYRHKAAGAVLTLIASPHKIGLVADVKQELTLGELVAAYGKDLDIVIAEGYKRSHVPKIEVYDTSRGEPPVCINDSRLIAIISDGSVEAHVPVFGRNDIEDIAQFILSRVIENPSPTPIEGCNPAEPFAHSIGGSRTGDEENERK
jgi:molybdopterin-guanine dinucleotide biosynthesis protein B